MEKINLIQTKESKEFWKKHKTNCVNCGTDTSKSRGEAEPTYNEDFCSLGCFNIWFIETTNQMYCTK